MDVSEWNKIVAAVIWVGSFNGDLKYGPGLGSSITSTRCFRTIYHIGFFTMVSR